MKVGVVGFPQAGKTTIFNALTGLAAEVGGYGEAGKTNVGVIKVPDARVDRLSQIFSPRKTTYAEIVFVDFAGQPSRERTALSAGTVAQIRDADAFALVLRGFADPVTGDAAEPTRDLAAFEAELILADLAVVEKRLERLKKEKGKEREEKLLAEAQRALEAETPLRACDWAKEDQMAMAGFGFLSRKPLLVVLNVAEEAAGQPLPAELIAALERSGLQGIALSGSIEMEIAGLGADDRSAFLADLGLTESAGDRFVRAAYGLLDQISFLTSGEDEVRAWTIKRGTPAVRAAGKIHSDIERGFIRAEVVHYDDFVEHGSDAKCREAGKLRLEGKDYVVRDGDIIHFRFNV
jgi:GTP-binding protein YchF